MKTVSIKDIIVLAILATVAQAIQAPNPVAGSRQLSRRNADAEIFARDPKKGGGSSGGSSSGDDDSSSGSSSFSCQSTEESCSLGCMPSGMTCCLASLDNEYCGATERCVPSETNILNYNCCPASSTTCNSTTGSPASKGRDRTADLSGAVAEKAPLATMGLLVILGFAVWA